MQTVIQITVLLRCTKCICFPFGYVDFLNTWNAEEMVDFDVIEAFWAEQVREYFRNQPFIMTADASRTIGANLEDLFDQAKKRQRQNPGTQYLGTVLQHLVAAKLCLIMPEGSFEIHGASVADASTERRLPTAGLC